MSKNEKLWKRIKNSASILIPLIFSSLDRIETISCGMELRAFGNKKKRTWYSEKPFLKRDYIVIGFVILLLFLVIILNINNKGRFYNPFI